MPGSPPPTRGTPYGGYKKQGLDRITPAYAGNTEILEVREFKTGDHPRLRGEHSKALRLIKGRQGSPPPTRGTHIIKRIRFKRTRITPAYAGNTALLQGRKSQVRDHPRLRGEHALIQAYDRGKEGSPPPTRGTPIFKYFPILLIRITPAYAGNTLSCIPLKRFFQDHPRLRGEHNLI